MKVGPYADIQVSDRLVILCLELQRELRRARKMGLAASVLFAGGPDLELEIKREGERTYHSGPVSAAGSP